MSRLVDPNGRPIISEAHPEFQKLANQRERMGVEAAKRAQGKAVEDDPSLGLVRELRAKFKIEVLFGPGRTLQGPNLCGVQVWESGRKLHGGGDELAYWCLANDGSGLGCGNIIVATHIRAGVAICPHCQKAINASKLTQMKIGRMSSRDLANHLEKMFRQLSSNADIYLKYDQSDVRYLAVLKQRGAKEARRLRGLNIYPLKNILKDTENGASVANRFFAFLTA